MRFLIRSRTAGGFLWTHRWQSPPPTRSQTVYSQRMSGSVCVGLTEGFLVPNRNGLEFDCILLRRVVFTPAPSEHFLFVRRVRPFWSAPWSTMCISGRTSASTFKLRTSCRWVYCPTCRALSIGQFHVRREHLGIRSYWICTTALSSGVSAGRATGTSSQLTQHQLRFQGSCPVTETLIMHSRMSLHSRIPRRNRDAEIVSQRISC